MKDSTTKHLRFKQLNIRAKPDEILEFAALHLTRTEISKYVDVKGLCSATRNAIVDKNHLFRLKDKYPNAKKPTEYSREHGNIGNRRYRK